MRNSTRTTIALTVAFLCCFVQSMRAQETTPDSARVDSARAVLLSFTLGSPIRVLTVGQTAIEGRLSSRSDTGIVIRQGHDSSSASVTRIAEIYRPAPNLKRGAVAGGLTGALLGGLVLGTLASGLCDRADCSGAFADGAMIGAAFGGALGVGIGLGIGSLTHHWERIW